MMSLSAHPSDEPSLVIAIQAHETDEEQIQWKTMLPKPLLKRSDIG
jgi:hypothetical protein